MIPKIIHYCWFGGNPLPDNVKVYIDSWKKYLPDFDIKQWDESNFNVNAREYTREAYYAGKFAFVSDVARLEALTKEGGLYLDTDILIKKEVPEEMFQHRAFCGFEHNYFIGTGIMAGEAHNPIFEEFLEEYNNEHFFRGFGFHILTNVHRLTSIMKKHGFTMNNKYQVVKGFAVYPQIILCGKDWQKGRYDTDETIMLHDFQSTWGSDYFTHHTMYMLRAFKTVLLWRLYYKKHFRI